MAPKLGYFIALVAAVALMGWAYTEVMTWHIEPHDHWHHID